MNKTLLPLTGQTEVVVQLEIIMRNRLFIIMFAVLSVRADEPSKEDAKRILEAMPRVEALKNAKDIKVPAYLKVRKVVSESENEAYNETLHTFYRGKSKVLEVWKRVSKTKPHSVKFSYYFFWDDKRVAIGLETDDVILFSQESDKVKVSYTVTKKVGKPDNVGICSATDYADFDVFLIDKENTRPMSGVEFRRGLLIGKEIMKVTKPLMEKIRAQQNGPAPSGTGQ